MRCSPTTEKQVQHTSHASTIIRSTCPAGCGHARATYGARWRQRRNGTRISRVYERAGKAWIMRCTSRTEDLRISEYFDRSKFDNRNVSRCAVAGSYAAACAISGEMPGFGLGSDAELEAVRRGAWRKRWKPCGPGKAWLVLPPLREPSRHASVTWEAQSIGHQKGKGM